MPRIRARVLELLVEHGHNTTSFQILEPGLRYWFDDDACVAYADTGRSWVVAGAPIAAPDRMIEIMERFTAAARAARRRPRFFGLERDVSQGSSFAVLHLGEQPTWNPQRWPETLRGVRSLREQLRRARAKGVRVRQVRPDELVDADAALRRSIDGMIARWLDARAMAPMGFVVYLDPYNLPEERRFFVAEYAGRVVGILIAVPIYARGGWFFEDVLRDPRAPNGTVELMFDRAMRVVAAQGSEHVTYGLAPLAGTPSPWIRRIRDHTRWLYDFEGLRAFKAKLRPASWQPVYLAFPDSERGPRAVVDTLAAFAEGSLARFGWRTLVHRARRVARVLAVLLVAWIAVLAAAPPVPWFGARSAQLAWVAFDVAVCVALWALSMRWRRWLAIGVAFAGFADAVVASVQLAYHNGAFARGWLEWAVVVAALVAPLVTAAFAWSARDRADLYQRRLADARDRDGALDCASP